MYNVVFIRNKRKEFCEQLQKLKKGSEVNLHVGDNTYYNAIFEKASPRTKNATFVIDKFYKEGGRLITIKCKEITSIDFPLSSPFYKENKEHDIGY
ncbi:hypothetical protein V7138_08905 [Bacillus sp. JJ1533]|uniref:hypothetical protein n=1 Tax=Bacillus sp. JJ1533 TaxID=3122959 RepID=UPI002FFFDF3A